jgi:hypothetical protein
LSSLLAYQAGLRALDIYAGMFWNKRDPHQKAISRTVGEKVKTDHPQMYEQWAKLKKTSLPLLPEKKEKNSISTS